MRLARHACLIQSNWACPDICFLVGHFAHSQSFGVQSCLKHSLLATSRLEEDVGLALRRKMQFTPSCLAFSSREQALRFIVSKYSVYTISRDTRLNWTRKHQAKDQETFAGQASGFPPVSTHVKCMVWSCLVWFNNSLLQFVSQRKMYWIRGQRSFHRTTFSNLIIRDVKACICKPQQRALVFASKLSTKLLYEAVSRWDVASTWHCWPCPSNLF